MLALLALTVALGIPASASTATPTWSHYAGHGPYVMVDDHTGYLWPVHAGVNAWSYGLRYGPCKTDQCVQVYEVNWGRNNLVATETWTSSGSKVTGATIRVNDAYEYLSYADRLQTTMHELGHALGLGHDGGQDCMNAYIRGYDTVSSYERGELTTIYAH